MKNIFLYLCFHRGFESETDTEEFEKVGQSPIDCQISQKHASTSIDHSRLTAENSTLTEVCSRDKKSTDSDTESQKPLINNTILNNKIKRSISPKRPPRLRSYSRSDSSNSSNSSLLPSIPEIDNSPQKEILFLSFSPDSPLTPHDHHYQNENTEFVTTEFYIDESIPVSPVYEHYENTSGDIKELNCEFKNAEMIKQLLSDSKTHIKLVQVHLIKIKIQMYLFSH